MGWVKGGKGGKKWDYDRINIFFKKGSYWWLLSSNCWFSSAGTMNSSAPKLNTPGVPASSHIDIESPFSLLVVYGFFISCCNREGFINNNQPLDPAFWTLKHKQSRRASAFLLTRNSATFPLLKKPCQIDLITDVTKPVCPNLDRPLSGLWKSPGPLFSMIPLRSSLPARREKYFLFCYTISTNILWCKSLPLFDHLPPLK